MNRLQAGYRVSDVDGSRLRGIPQEPIPRQERGPVERDPVRSARGLPMSIRYTGSERVRYRYAPVAGLGNRPRNTLPADVWITGNRYNTTALYRPPTAIANPTWRITNVTNGDIRNIEKLQAQKRQRPPGR